MFCAHCGRKIPDNAGFCAFCGKETVKRTDLSEAEEKPSDDIEEISIDEGDRKETDSKNLNSKGISGKTLVMVIISIIALCIVVAIAFFLNKNGMNKDESLSSSSVANDTGQSAPERSEELPFKDDPNLSNGRHTAEEGNGTSSEDNTPSLTSQNNVKGIRDLEDGWYIADFKSGSNKLQQRETRHGKGEFYVENGMGRIRLSLTDVSVQKLFQGTAEDAKKAGAKLLDLKDQKTGNGIPVRTGFLTVPYLDKEFNCAVLEADGSWSDHKVMVSNPTTEGVTKMVSTDGTNKIMYECEGSSPNGGITNAVIITKNRNSDVKIEMGSNKYTKAIVGGKSINSVIENGRSTFTFPAVFDEEINIKATVISEGKSFDEEYTIKLIWKSLPQGVKGTRFVFK